MYVRKVRGQNKISKIIMSRSEVEIAKKLGMNLEDFVREFVRMIAKERRWKWYFEQEKNNA